MMPRWVKHDSTMKFYRTRMKQVKWWKQVQEVWSFKSSLLITLFRCVRERERERGTFNQLRPYSQRIKPGRLLISATLELISDKVHSLLRQSQSKTPKFELFDWVTFRTRVNHLKWSKKRTFFLFCFCCCCCCWCCCCGGGELQRYQYRPATVDNSSLKRKHSAKMRREYQRKKKNV